MRILERDVLATSKTVLASKGFLGDTSDEAVCVAIKYFVAELPVCLNVPDIINISSSLYAYKYPPSDFLTGVYDKNSPFFSYVSSKQGYFAVNFS